MCAQKYCALMNSDSVSLGLIFNQIHLFNKHKTEFVAQIVILIYIQLSSRYEQPG